MTRNDTKFMDSAIALADDLHFQRAAYRLHISQPMLTKNIQDLETLVGGPLFTRDRKHVKLNEAGRAYVKHARLSLLYGERAIHDAQTAMNDIDPLYHVGRSPFIDPFLISTLLSIQLPLFPRLKLELVSQYSVNLVDDLLTGALDMAIAVEPPESSLLTRVQIAASPFYVAMAQREQLTRYPAVTFDLLKDRQWILFERRLHPPLYDAIMQAAGQHGLKSLSIQHTVVPEEAFPFVTDSSAVAFVGKAGALRIARNGVTVRPLNEPDICLRTFLVSRADDNSKLTSEFVRSFMRKVSDVNRYKQLRLPLST